MIIINGDPLTRSLGDNDAADDDDRRVMADIVEIEISVC